MDLDVGYIEVCPTEAKQCRPIVCKKPLKVVRAVSQLPSHAVLKANCIEYGGPASERRPYQSCEASGVLNRRPPMS